MTEDNSRQHSESSIDGLPQPQGVYPPAQGYSPARSAFEDIRIGDYTRDGTAAVLLFVSFFLPWSATVAITRVGSSALVVLLVLPTLLSLVSLSLPYVARLGMLGPNWNVGQIRVLRLVANGPLIATAVGLVVYDVIRGMFRFSESSSIFTGNGVGAGAWFGLAGALLAAQPRAAEIRIDPRTAPRWLALVKPLVFVAWGSSVASALLALIYILVSASRYRYYDGPDIREPDRSLRVVGRSDRRGGCCGSRSRQTLCVLAPHHRRARHRSPRSRITPLDQRGHKCRAVPHGHG